MSGGGAGDTLLESGSRWLQMRLALHYTVSPFVLGK